MRRAWVTEVTREPREISRTRTVGFFVHANADFICREMPNRLNLAGMFLAYF